MEAIFTAISQGRAHLDACGPEVFRYSALAELAFDSFRTSAGATHLPDAETPCVFCLGWPHAAFTVLRSFF